MRNWIHYRLLITSSYCRLQKNFELRWAAQEVTMSLINLCVCLCSHFFSCDEQLKKWRCHSVCLFVRPCVPFFFRGDSLSSSHIFTQSLTQSVSYHLVKPLIILTIPFLHIIGYCPIYSHYFFNPIFSYAIFLILILSLPILWNLILYSPIF